jgi:hypothetical protein
MNLRELAESDLAITLEDSVSGFGTTITLTEPNLSVAVKAVLSVTATGDEGTVLANNIQWSAGGENYRQVGAVTIGASGTATVSVQAEVAGADGNQDDGTVINTVVPVAGLTGAVVASTTTAGVDRDPDVVHTVQGQYTRIGVEIDPETGLQVVGKKSAVTVRLSSIGALPADGWQVEAADITGATVKGKAHMTMLDLTLGVATMIIKR